MSKKILLLHGWGGSDMPHWQAWLAGELAKETLLITSINDPSLNATEAKKLHKALNVPMKTLENVGHINSDSGFGKWEWMLEEVNS